MRDNPPDLPRWPPRAAPNGSIKPLLEAQESSTQVQVLPAKRPSGSAQQASRGVSSSATSPPEHPDGCCCHHSGMQPSPPSTQWLEAFPLESTSTESIATTFVRGCVARFGVPDHITSDRGPQFCSTLWAQLSQCLGTLHHLTTAYPPQAKSMEERRH